MIEITKFKIDGITCSMCIKSIEKKLSKLDGIENYNINIVDNTAFIKYNKNVINPEKIIEEIEKIGYKVIFYQDDNLKNRKKLYISLIGILVSFVMMFGMHFLHHNIIAKIMFPLITFIMMYLFKDIFITSIENIKNKSITMEVMYLFSITISLLVSLIGTLFNLNTFNYYDTSIMLASFLSLGKYIEHNAKLKTNDVLSALRKLVPEDVLVKKNGEYIKVPLNDIRVGDIVKVNAGDIIPVDGKIIEGISYVDESYINGEPIPKQKDVNDKVFAGSYNTNGTLSIQVENIQEKTIIGKIINILEKSQLGETRYNKIVDRVSAVFFPTILIIGVIVFLLYYFYYEYDLKYAIERIISIYVIACPCALALATPTAIATGIGYAAKHGILIKNIEIIEKYLNTNTIIFDKTGTITKGKPTVKNLYVFNGVHQNILNIAYNFSLHSNHPLLNAVKKQAEKYSLTDILDLTSFEEIKGNGVKATIFGKEYYLGSYKYALKYLKIADEINEIYDNITREGSSPIFLFDNTQILGIFDIRDEIKDDAKDVVEYFANKGYDIVLLSGDNHNNVEKIAKQLNITHFYFEAFPDKKLDIIKNIKQTKNVIFVGDGINDTLALMEANVGISFNNGSDIAKNSGNILLMNDYLKTLINMDKIFRRIQKQININISWALIYNIIFIPLAAGIIKSIVLSPLLSSFMMVFSSISVILLSLTIKNYNLR